MQGKIVYSNKSHQLRFVEGKKTVVLETADGKMLDTASCDAREWNWGAVFQAILRRFEAKGGVR